MYLDLLQKFADKNFKFSLEQLQFLGRNPTYFPRNGTPELLSHILEPLPQPKKNEYLVNLLWEIANNGPDSVLQPILDAIGQPTEGQWASILRVLIDKNRLDTANAMLDQMQARSPTGRNLAKEWLANNAQSSFYDACSNGDLNAVEFLLDTVERFGTKEENFPALLLKDVEWGSLITSMATSIAYGKSETALADILPTLLTRAAKYSTPEDNIPLAIIAAEGSYAGLRSNLVAHGSDNTNLVMQVMDIAEKSSTREHDVFGEMVSAVPVDLLMVNPSVHHRVRDYLHKLPQDKKEAYIASVKSNPENHDPDNSITALFADPISQEKFQARFKRVARKATMMSHSPAAEPPVKHEYDEQHFNTFKRLMQTAAIYEDNTKEDVEDQAIKLATLFKGDVQKADAFFTKIAAHDSKHPVFDTMLFGLPKQGQWNPDVWADLLVRIGGPAADCLSLAPHIEKKAKARQIPLDTIEPGPLKELGAMKLYGIALAGVPNKDNTGLNVYCNPIAVPRGNRQFFEIMDDLAFTETVSNTDPVAQRACFVKLVHTLEKIIKLQEDSCKEMGVAYQPVVLEVGEDSRKPVYEKTITDALFGKPETGDKKGAWVTRTASAAADPAFINACRILPRLLNECIWRKGSFTPHASGEKRLTTVDELIQSDSEKELIRLKQRVAIEGVGHEAHREIIEIAKHDGEEWARTVKENDKIFASAVPRGYKEDPKIPHPFKINPKEAQEKFPRYCYHTWHKDYRDAFYAGFKREYGKKCVTGACRHIKLPMDDERPFFTDPCADAIIEVFQKMDGIRKTGHLEDIDATRGRLGHIAGQTGLELLCAAANPAVPSAGGAGR